MTADTPQLDHYKLEDRYLRESGRVFLTGTQALVRIPLMQAALDRRNGLNTAGMVSGYRGSPLGAYDQALWQAKDLLQQNRIDFVPAINEDLAATIMLGTQQVETDENRQVDGVFGLWYGKAPVSTGPVTLSSMAPPTAVRPTAVSWWWRGMTMVACRPPCPISPMSRLWPGSCRP